MAPTALAAIGLVVRDYDEAIAWYVRCLRFVVTEDRDEGHKRWVTLAPRYDATTRVVLGRATTAQQRAAIGNQSGGRVLLFLHSDDFADDHAHMLAHGVNFLEAPRHEAYGLWPCSRTCTAIAGTCCSPAKAQEFVRWPGLLAGHPLRRMLMTIRIRLAAALLAATFAVQVHAQDAAPAVGSAAPAFKLQDQKGDWHTLNEYQGKWVVLYFYPKDDTPGCTTEVCTFRDDVLKLHKAGAEVLGVSLDDIQSHAAFAAKYHVPFPLLSDNTQSTAKAYGVLTYSDKMKMSYAKRETFLIDPSGKVAKHYVGVDPKENSGQVLTDLADLKKSA